ncbi:hypothetical protein ACQW02_27245 [Humitalea sp. 24SJ18S-53]|uniref:hypothetical protein n=1 Tax=Humitalea sp. 24SJ18S-53 TaxID=3422307 RepID=UPI003D677777
MDPLSFGMFAWQATWVFAMRSASLAGDPINASARLADMVDEKQRAFTAGMMGAVAAMAVGSRPDVVAAAAMRPAQRRVAVNAKRLATGRHTG